MKDACVGGESAAQTHSHPHAVASGKVAIVVAAKKYCFPLERCLASLKDLLENPRDLVFVDDGSGGEMSRWAHELLPDITVITRPQNGHFCAAYNSGLAHAVDRDYEFALIVNSDTEVDNPGFVQDLLRVAERHPRGAFFGPKVFFRKSGNVQNTVLAFPWFRRTMASKARDWFLPRRPVRSGDQEKQVEYLNGVCVLCRVPALREVGLMDETLGIYVEDVDWSWRARQRGWYSVYAPIPSIVHHQAAVGYEHYSQGMFMLRRNQVYWHMKCRRPLEARLYAAFALRLAKIRRWQARNDVATRQHYDHYIRKFTDVSKRLLAGETPGPWFGPPLGPWQP